MAKPTLGARIRAARTELGITQPALAAALNIPYRRLQDIELDKKAVDTNLANRFERQLFDKVKARRKGNVVALKKPRNLSPTENASMRELSQTVTLIALFAKKNLLTEAKTLVSLCLKRKLNLIDLLSDTRNP